MSTLGSVSFWIDTLERAIRSFAGGVVTIFSLGVADIGISVPLHVAFEGGGVYAMITVLTCIASLTFPKADKDTGSFLAIPPYQLGRIRGWFTNHVRRS